MNFFYSIKDCGQQNEGDISGRRTHEVNGVIDNRGWFTKFLTKQLGDEKLTIIPKPIPNQFPCAKICDITK